MFSDRQTDCFDLHGAATSFEAGVGAAFHSACDWLKNEHYGLF